MSFKKNCRNNENKKNTYRNWSVGDANSFDIKLYTLQIPISIIIHWQSVPSICAILWNVLAKKFIAKFGIIWKIQVSQNCYSLKYDLLEMVWIIFLPFRTFPNLIYRSPRRVYRVTYHYLFINFFPFPPAMLIRFNMRVP